MLIDVKQFDPPQPVEYLDLLTRLLRHYRAVGSHEELSQAVGLGALREISERSDIRQMDAQDVLPENFIRRSYQYCDGRGGRGVLEAVFDNVDLVNIRAQYFLSGWFARSKAHKLLNTVLVPSLEVSLGPAEERTAHHARFSWRGIAVLARYVPGTPSVSTYLMNEAYA